jgi:hypothetical protein
MAEAFPMKLAIRWGAVLLGAAVVATPIRARAQEPEQVDVRRPVATRADLQKALDELEKLVSSTGYSKSYRKAREAEAEMVRQRLADGDFQSGDQIDIVVTGEGSLSGKFGVLQDRTISLPQLPPISLNGVLRSEIRDYLAAEIGKYVKNPQVTVQGAYIRVAIMGAVGRPGYYTLPADNLVTDAIMAAGGPGNGTQMEKSAVRRSGEEVIAGPEIQRAIEQGQSLDQLNLHGGDELVIGGGAQRGGGGFPGTGRGGIRQWLWPVQLALSVTVLLTRIF